MLAFLGVVVIECGMAAVMFLMLTLVEASIPRAVYVTIWLALWAICVRALFVRGQRTARVAAVTGTSFALGIVCVIVSALAVVVGITLGVAAYVNLGGRL